MCLKKLCSTLYLLLATLPAAFAGEHHGLLPDDTVNVDRADKSAESSSLRMVKARPVDASGFRLAVLPDAILLRWRFENLVNFGTAVLEESSDGHPFTAISILSRDSKAYTDVDLRPDRLYRIRMVATDGTVVMSAVLTADGRVSATAATQ